MGDAVERYHLDWLKWDNSGLRARPATATITVTRRLTAPSRRFGQYEIWQYLRARFPNLMLEECGYPSRLDYGLARTATSHWLSGQHRTALESGRADPRQLHLPRRPQRGHDPRRRRCRGRSRPGHGSPQPDDGPLRAGTLHGKLDERASLLPRRSGSPREEFPGLQAVPPPFTAGCVSPPAALTEADAWDAIEFCRRDGSEAVVLAFRSGSRNPRVELALRGLAPGVMYEVTRVNSGETRSIEGKALAEGVTVALPGPDMSEILLLRAVQR